MIESAQSLISNFDLKYVEYAASATLLLMACFHSLVYSTVYTISLITVVIQGEKGKENKTSTRLVAFFMLIFYLGYNMVVYFVVLSTVDWSRLFVGRIFARSVFDHKWAVFLFYEPIVQLMTSWFKIGCALHSLVNQPSTAAVTGSNLLRILRRTHRNRNIQELPNITVVMPIYNEPLPSLMTAINSVVETVYPNHRMHLILAFDDEEITPLFRNVQHCLSSASDIDLQAMRKQSKHAVERYYAALEKKLNEAPPKQWESYPHVQDLEYHGLRVTPCRFPHGGKRHAQMCAYRYLISRYGNLNSAKPLLLFIDSDIQLDPFAINYFVYDLMTGKYREALTGLITCKTADTYNFLKILQDTEYIESQMMQRTTEDYLGSVSCLPGALTIVRFEALQCVAEQYFNQQNSTDSLDFARCHLGEDRYLTHLLMEKCPEQYRIGYCSAARCKTEGCSSFMQLMKQRRRWYLGTLGNEIHMLCSPILWKHVPGLLILQLFTSLKNGPLFIYVFVSEQMMGRGTVLTLVIAVLIFAPIWLFVAGFGIRIHRLKIAWCYPFIVFFLPIMSAFFQLYGVWTLRVRSWGGPRAEANPVKLPTGGPTDAASSRPAPPASATEKSAYAPERSDAGNRQSESCMQSTSDSLSRPNSHSRHIQGPTVVIPMDAIEDKKIKPSILIESAKNKTSPPGDSGPIRPRLTVKIPETPPANSIKYQPAKWSQIQVRNQIR